MSKLARAAYWLTPPLAGLALYFPGLVVWFQKDDFAWLGLRAAVDGGQSIWWALFAPLAQGTIRTLSERVFYFSFFSMFGWHALPYRAVAFLTFGAAAMLLCAVCVRLTGSRAAGLCAAMLWTANNSLSVPLSWTAVYYELAWALCALLMLWLLIRFAETGDRRFYFAHLAIFLAGFFVLELNVVWPAIATVYAWLRARKILPKVLPLFAFSAIYTVVHTAVAPLPTSGVYKLHWDAHIFTTCLTYCNWAFGAGWGRLLGIVSTRIRTALSIAVAAGLLVFLFAKLRKREWIVLLFPAWFFIALSPLAPLRDHMSQEYLTVPSIGLAMWGGWALASSWRAGPAARILAMVALASYLGTSIPVGRMTAQSFYDRGERIRAFFWGVVNQTPRDKAVLLRGLNGELFGDAVYDRPFRILGMNEVYVVPEDAAIATVPGFVADPPLVRELLAQDRAVVFDVSGGRVRDVTAEYRAGR
jgi:hypothetical protein